MDKPRAERVEGGWMPTVKPLPDLAAPPRIPWRAFRLVWAMGAVGVGVSFGLAAWFAHEAPRLDAARFLQQGNAIGVALEHRVEAIEAKLRHLQGILNAKETPDLLDWGEFMNRFSPQWNNPGMLALGYATNAGVAEALRRLEDWTRPVSPRDPAEFYGLPEDLAGEKAWSVWVAEVYRDDLRPIQQFSREEAAIEVATGRAHFRRYQGPMEPLTRSGHGLAREVIDGRWMVTEHAPDTEALLHAIYRDDVKITRGEEVLRRPDGSSVRGVTMLVPTYHPRRAEFWRALPPDPENRETSHWLRWNLNTGFVFAHLDLAAMLKEAQGPGEPMIRVEIHAAYDDEHTPGAVGPASWLNPDGQPVRASDPQFRPSFHYTHLWRMYGDKWTLFFHTTPLFDAQSTRYRAWWAGGWGLLTTGLVCWVLGLQVAGRWRETRRATALAEARDALVAVQRERERLSHDLHDGAIQSLYAIQLGLTQAASDVRAVAGPAGQRLIESRANLDAVIGELRQFMGELGASTPPPQLHGLAAVLESVVRRLRPASSAAIELLCDPTTARRLDEVQAMQLAAIAREALSNSLRHAGARRITVRLATEGPVAVLEVRDDGAGFDPVAKEGQGVGLASLRRRAESLGGPIGIVSAPGAGTTVTVRAPLKPADADPVADGQEHSRS